VDDARGQAQPRRQKGEKHPGIQAVEEHLEDAVDGDKAGHIIGVPLRQLIPHQHHRDAACNADQDQAAHVGRLAAQAQHR
jgi:hypothetical protein